MNEKSELENLNRIIGRYDLSKQKKLYDYILSKITVPKIGEVIPNNLNQGKDCFICSSDLVYKPNHAIKKTFWGTGNHKSKIMFIHINPGQGLTDVDPRLSGITETGINLTGRGSILRYIAKIAGYENFEDNIYSTNCYKCCTKKNVNKNMARKNCIKHLKEEIYNIAPEKIAVFGKPPKKSVENILNIKLEKSVNVIDIKGKKVHIKYFYHYSNIFGRYCKANKLNVEKYYGNYIGWIQQIIDFIK